MRTALFYLVIASIGGIVVYTLVDGLLDAKRFRDAHRAHQFDEVNQNIMHVPVDSVWFFIMGQTELYVMLTTPGAGKLYGEIVVMPESTFRKMLDR